MFTGEGLGEVEGWYETVEGREEDGLVLTALTLWTFVFDVSTASNIMVNPDPVIKISWMSPESSVLIVTGFEFASVNTYGDGIRRYDLSSHDVDARCDLMNHECKRRSGWVGRRGGEENDNGYEDV